jgi:hypothetical protein
VTLNEAIVKARIAIARFEDSGAGATIFSGDDATVIETLLVAIEDQQAQQFEMFTYRWMDLNERVVRLEARQRWPGGRGWG